MTFSVLLYHIPIFLQESACRSPPFLALGCQDQGHCWEENSCPDGGVKSRQGDVKRGVQMSLLGGRSLRKERTGPLKMVRNTQTVFEDPRKWQ